MVLVYSRPSPINYHTKEHMHIAIATPTGDVHAYMLLPKICAVMFLIMSAHKHTLWIVMHAEFHILIIW